MKPTRANFASCIVLLALLTWPTAIQASLVLIGPNPSTGTGLGATRTILALQNPDGQTEESGCVSPQGFDTCEYDDSTVLQAQSQVQVIGAVEASNIRIVFNPAEPGGDLLITLNELVVNFYNGNVLIFSTSGLRDASGVLVDSFTGLDFSPSSGTGNSGYLIRLTTAEDGIAGDDQSWALQVALDAQPEGSIITAGVGAILTNSAGGPETFAIREFTPNGGGGVPEPSTGILLGTSLLAIAIAARGRQG
jgi:hypothetical protein